MDRTLKSDGDAVCKASRSIQQRLADFAREFDPCFAGFLQPDGEVASELMDAVRYAALAPGKRIRPFLVVRCCELTGGAQEIAWPVAAAVECVHAFSLIHDDLPAMDDDDMRRGQSTCHKKFSEATAILAGDTLVVLAFELLAGHVRDASTAARMTLELARHSGWTGMIGGQAADMAAQDRPSDIEITRFIHERKTARLFELSCRLGALAGGGDDQTLDSLGTFGRHLGHAFQISDDLLDVTSNVDRLGKKAGKDALAKKQTYPRCLGVEESRRLLQVAVADAVEALGWCGGGADDLRELARFVADRDF